jgi:hypothetical protein
MINFWNELKTRIRFIKNNDIIKKEKNIKIYL